MPRILSALRRTLPFVARRRLEAVIAENDRLAQRLEQTGTAKSKAEQQLRTVLRVGVNPFLYSLIQNITAVDLNSEDSQLCMIGPNGCQSHPGFGIGPDKECGVAWLRSWLNDGGHQDAQPLLMSVGSLLGEHGKPAAHLIVEGLERLLPELDQVAAIASGPERSAQGRADRTRARLARDLVDGFQSIVDS